MYYLSLHLAFYFSISYPLLPLLFPNKNSIDFNYACGHKGIDLGRYHACWWGTAHQRGVQLVSRQKTYWIIRTQDLCSIKMAPWGVAMWHSSYWAQLYCRPPYCKAVEYQTIHFPSVWRYSFFPQRLRIRGMQWSKCSDAYMESIMYNMCVLSQGGMLSDGRKGNRMYSYPLLWAQGWLNKDPEFGRS